jgi:D-3-phosphoglycerate dehydrogenase
MKRVCYIDPLWIRSDRGTIDPQRATIERDIFGDSVDLQFGPVEGPCDAVVVSRAQITPEILDVAGPDCRVAGRLGIGYDNLNVPLLRERGIFGFNVPDYCIDEVSSHAIALMLALERRIVDYDRQIKAGTFDTYGGRSPRRMSELTLWIIGFGTIGRATNRKAQAFFSRVIAYDPYVHADLMAGNGVTKYATLDDLLAASDVISIHAFLDEGSRHLIDAVSLAHARPGALLINTARGGILDESAVLASLESGRLAGFGSDVFDPERPAETETGRRLVARHDVIATPHIAFRSIESERSQRTRVAETIAVVLATGAPPVFGRLA